MRACGATMTEHTSVGTVKFICTKPAGHDDAHFDAEGPIAWTSSIAATPPRDVTQLN
jgi:hypothetical protein